MRWFSLVIIVTIAAEWLLMAVMSIYEARKDPLSWRMPARLLAGSLCVLGIAGFMGSAFSSLGGLDWAGSFEWPVGRANGVVMLADGTYVVPHTPSGRIQLYNANRRFLRGWRIPDGGSGTFTARLNSDQQIEIHTARGKWHYLYDAKGNLLSRSQYDYRIEPSPMNPSPEARTMTFPTRWYLWPLTSPIYAWLCCGAAMGLWVVTKRKSSSKATKATTA